MKRRTYWEIGENVFGLCDGTYRQSEAAAYKAVAREAVRRYKMKHRNDKFDPHSLRVANDDEEYCKKSVGTFECTRQCEHLGPCVAHGANNRVIAYHDERGEYHKA